jgi:U3 small nucleolar RNA-associated protein 6
MERMVNELDDLESRGLFSRREIAEIVKQRRKFEYRLKRPSPLKQDYLSYIEYEKNLDMLRLLRKKAVSQELKKKGNKKMKKSLSDFAGVSRIIDIYRLATNRFKGDIELWYQYLEFCRERRNGRIKEVLAQVIRFHPKVAGVWIYAASWEFDNNLNVASARALMQSGLRACPNSEDLWVEYLRMELTYLNKLKARKVALGEDSGTFIQNPEEEQWRDENKELFMSLDDNKEKDSDDMDPEKKIDVFGEHGFSILQTVYSSAIQALPLNFSLRTKFLEILEVVKLAHSDDMKKIILDDMKRDFSKDAEYWDWLARVEIKDTNKEISPNKLENAIQVYEEALKNVPTSSMFNLYTRFLMDVIMDKTFESKISIDPISQVLKVYENAEKTGCISDDLACQHVSLFLDLGKLDEARTLAEKLCKGNLSDSANLWVLLISIEIKCLQKTSLSPSEADTKIIFELFRIVLMKMSVSKAESLWHMALKFFANKLRYFNKLVEILVKLLARDGGNDDGFSLSSVIVDFVHQRDGIQGARDMYKRFLELPHPGLVIYKKFIEMELNLVCAGNKDSLSRTRKLYESALSTYTQDLSLWRDYHSMETKMGTSDSAAGVHWRARKALGGNF